MDTYTLGRSPLDEGSAHRGDLYTHNTQPSQETHINSPARLEPETPVNERPQAYATDHSATGIVANFTHRF